jgi:hypothetical protein
MSSALRSFSQIEPTIKFLRLVPNAYDPSTNYVYMTDASMDAFVAISTPTGNGLNTIVVSNSNPATSFSSSGAATLVRDLGRRVTIVSPTEGNAHRQVWIQVQAVQGVISEGVSVPDDATYGTFWIPIYVDDAAGVAVEWARLG